MSDCSTRRENSPRGRARARRGRASRRSWRPTPTIGRRGRPSPARRPTGGSGRRRRACANNQTKNAVTATTITSAAVIASARAKSWWVSAGLTKRTSSAAGLIRRRRAALFLGSESASAFASAGEVASSRNTASVSAPKTRSRPRRAISSPLAAASGSPPTSRACRRCTGPRLDADRPRVRTQRLPASESQRSIGSAGTRTTTNATFPTTELRGRTGAASSRYALRSLRTRPRSIGRLTAAIPSPTFFPARSALAESSSEAAQGAPSGPTHPCQRSRLDESHDVGEPLLRPLSPLDVLGGISVGERRRDDLGPCRRRRELGRAIEEALEERRESAPRRGSPGCRPTAWRARPLRSTTAP